MFQRCCLCCRVDLFCFILKSANGILDFSFSVVMFRIDLAALSSWSFLLMIFVTASHQTGLDTRSKARRPIKVGIEGRERSGTSRDSSPASH